MKKQIPIAEQPEKNTPDTAQPQKPLPRGPQPKRELPQPGSPENTVTIGNRLVEIKPTKLKYQRNRTATLYRLLEMYPLVDILAMEAGALGDDRDGDKAVMDWLIAVTDDEELVLAHYDEMDTGLIEKMLAIFKRVNKIDEREAHQKKRMPEPPA